MLYTVTPGRRLLQASLDLTVRTSQGGWQNLTLPGGADVQSVTVKGQARTLRPDKRKLAIPLDPGEQSIVVKWQQPWERAFRETVPPLDLGAPAANVHVALHLGESRWLLWARGPDWGPAVLFWSHLALVAFAAVLLSRLRRLPLKLHHWLLMAAGLSQLPAPALLVVVGWFGAFAWRKARVEQEPPLHPALFDLLQLALAAFSFVFAGVLWAAIHHNLLLDVDMQVRGAASDERVLRWYVDRVPGALPEPWIATLPLYMWRVAMLLWALWLVAALLRWLPWAWRAFCEGGLWRTLPKPTPAVRPMPPPPPPPPPSAQG